MMEHFVSYFKLYDFFAYFLTGFTQIVCFVIFYIFYFDITLQLITESFKTYSFSIFSFFIFFVFCYIIGQLIQAIANVISSEHKSSNFKCSLIEQKIKAFFQIEKATDRLKWEIPYQYALSNDPNNQILQTNYYYGLFRGLEAVFSINTAACLIIIFVNSLFSNEGYARVKPALILFLIISITLKKIFNLRKLRFWDYLQDKVMSIIFISIENKK